MIKILSIVALLMASATPAAMAQQLDHDDWKEILPYAPAGADPRTLTHEEVHMLLVMINSTEHESEIRRAVKGFFDRRG